MSQSSALASASRCRGLGWFAPRSQSEIDVTCAPIVYASHDWLPFLPPVLALSSSRSAFSFPPEKSLGLTVASLTVGNYAIHDS